MIQHILFHCMKKNLHCRSDSAPIELLRKFTYELDTQEEFLKNLFIS